MSISISPNRLRAGGSATVTIRSDRNLTGYQITEVRFGRAGKSGWSHNGLKIDPTRPTVATTVLTLPGVRLGGHRPFDGTEDGDLTFVLSGPGGPITVAGPVSVTA